MTRYTLRALMAQWRAWSGTVVVLAFAATLVNVCLAHRASVNRPEVVATARAAGVGPANLEMSGTSIYLYSTLVAVPVVAVVGQSCVQALRTTWARWRLAGAAPRQVFITVLATVATLGLLACVPGVLAGLVLDQPVSSVLTRMASARMGRIEVVQTPTTIALTGASVAVIALLGAIGPARSAVRTPATEAIRSATSTRRRMGATRWILAVVWMLACGFQLLLALTVEPLPSQDGDFRLVADRR